MSRANPSRVRRHRCRPGIESLEGRLVLNGAVVTAASSLADEAWGAAVQSNGSIVTAGYAVVGSGRNTESRFAMIRHFNNGGRDATFGTNGIVTGAFQGQAYSVAIQADGKIVAAGYAYSSQSQRDFALLRLNANGTPDTTFGAKKDGGKVVTPVSASRDQIHAVALQADGKIVAAGEAIINGSVRWVLARYTTAGALDSTFGSGGVVTTDVGPGDDNAGYSLVIQPDGKILFLGQSAIGRYLPNGQLDAGFGAGGIAPASPGLDAKSLAIQPDGKLVVAGHVQGTGLDIAVARHNADGTLDTSFGPGATGWVTTDIAGLDDVARSVRVQASGRIVVVGSTGPGQEDALALVGYTAGGQLDATFGTGGITTTSVRTVSYARGGGLDASGRILAVGGAFGNGTQNVDSFVARYTPDGLADPTFGGSSLRATLGAATALREAPGVTARQLRWATRAAVVRWRAAGVATPRPRALDVRAADLAPGELGRFDGATLWVDRDGAGRGWFVDATPSRSEEFLRAGGLLRARPGTDSDGRYDLVSALAHELGHALGFDHQGRGVMAETLAPGVRRVPSPSGGPPLSPRSSRAAGPAGGTLASRTAGRSLSPADPPGTVVTSVGLDDDWALDVTVAPDGRIVTAGAAIDSRQRSGFAIARYNANGGLDSSFGGSGKVTTANTTQARAVAVQSDGKVVAVGYTGSTDSTLVRYNANGTLDTSFGGKKSKGVITSDLSGGGRGDLFNDVALQVDGKIVAAGYASRGGMPQFLVARYTAVGDLDATFGSGGTVATAIGSDAEGDALAIQPDGKILVVGDVAGTLGTARRIGLARYGTNGALDSGFGAGGVVTLSLGGWSLQPQSIALQPDGKIVVAGYAHNLSFDPGTDPASKQLDLFVARFNANGAPDTGFGTGGSGVVITDAGAQDFGHGVVVQPGGRIVVIGRHEVSSGSKQAGSSFLLAGYTANGALDPAFGAGGFVLTTMRDGAFAEGGGALDLQGRIVAAGGALDGSLGDWDTAVARYTPDGGLDATFGA